MGPAQAQPFLMALRSKTKLLALWPQHHGPPCLTTASCVCVCVHVCMLFKCKLES